MSNGRLRRRIMYLLVCWVCTEKEIHTSGLLQLLSLVKALIFSNEPTGELSAIERAWTSSPRKSPLPESVTAKKHINTRVEVACSGLYVRISFLQQGYNIRYIHLYVSPGAYCPPKEDTFRENGLSSSGCESVRWPSGNILTHAPEGAPLGKAWTTPGRNAESANKTTTEEVSIFFQSGIKNIYNSMQDRGLSTYINDAILRFAALNDDLLLDRDRSL